MLMNEMFAILSACGIRQAIHALSTFTTENNAVIALTSHVTATDLLGFASTLKSG